MVANLSYNAQKDLIPVALASVVPLALVVPTKAPYDSINDLAKALLDKKPADVRLRGHRHARTFRRRVLKPAPRPTSRTCPTKGAGPALNDLIGGHVDMYFPGFPAAVPLLKSGTVKLLAVSSAKRSGAAPEIPTVAEAIKDPNFDLTLWQGFFAPAGTPKPIVERLNTEINKILGSPEMQAQAPRRRRRRAHRLDRRVLGLHEIRKRQVRPDHQRSGVKPE